MSESNIIGKETGVSVSMKSGGINGYVTSIKKYNGSFPMASFSRVNFM